VDDETLSTPVNEFWTVAGVLGHLAYWDVRFQVLAEKIERGEPWAPGDAEPDGDWLNDSTRPIIHAIAPRAAAELALWTAEETDALAARLPLNRLWPDDPDSPISPAVASTAGSTSTRSKPPCVGADSGRVRARSASELLVADTVRLIRGHTELAVAVFLVFGEVALEPADDAVAFEREDVRRDPVEEPPVVADHHRAARE
jgi:hypothetical protein